VAETSK